MSYNNWVCYKQGVEVTDQGWEPKPYHASWRIWKPRPSRIVFLFPMERIRIPNTTVYKKQTGHNISQI